MMKRAGCTKKADGLGRRAAQSKSRGAGPQRPMARAAPSSEGRERVGGGMERGSRLIIAAVREMMRRVWMACRSAPAAVVPGAAPTNKGIVSIRRVGGKGDRNQRQRAFRQAGWMKGSTEGDAV